jgi:hypothetical protein
MQASVTTKVIAARARCQPQQAPPEQQESPLAPAEWHGGVSDAGDLDAPDRRAGFQRGPFELPQSAVFELIAQRLRVVVVHELQRLAGGQGVEATEDQRVALTRRNGAQVQLEGGLNQGCSHGNLSGVKCAPGRATCAVEVR